MVLDCLNSKRKISKLISAKVRLLKRICLSDYGDIDTIAYLIFVENEAVFQTGNILQKSIFLLLEDKVKF